MIKILPETFTTKITQLTQKLAEGVKSRDEDEKIKKQIEE